MASGHALVQIRSLKNQAVIADKCLMADSFLGRFKGLMGKSRFETGEGLWLRPCNNIHMWFMRFAIDVLFVKKSGESWRVCSARENARPWRLLPLWDSQATDTIELPAGTVRRCGIEAGDELTCTS
jgi:hypothetical protein